jgi:hypothetical protein
MLIPAVVRSTAYVCSRMMVGNASSIPAEDMDVRVLCLMRVVQVAAFVAIPVAARSNGRSTLVTLPSIVTRHRDTVDGTSARVTYQKLVTR